MTSCKKPIWKVTFMKEYDLNERTEIVLAYSFAELLSFYNEKGISKIIKVEKTNDEATYHY